MTRVQLNLLGRRSYLSSVISLATGQTNQSVISLENNDDVNPDQSYGNDFESNRLYLTFSWWLLHRGWKEIMSQVEVAVKEVFGPLSPRDELTLERFSTLTLEVRKKVEGATETDRQARKWLPHLLPPREKEEFVLNESGMTLERKPVATNSPLRRLLDETSDLIDSPSFTIVLTLLLDSAFSTLVDEKLASQAFAPSPAAALIDSSQFSINPPSRITEIDKIQAVKLPIVLAVLTKQAHAIGHGEANEYLARIETVRELEAFAAVVYSCNWQAEVEEADGAMDYDVPRAGSKDSERERRFERAWAKAETR